MVFFCSRIRLVLSLACLGCCCMPSGSAKAAIYSFVDENGLVHFSNVPSDPRYRPKVPHKASFGPPSAKSWLSGEDAASAYALYIRAAGLRFGVDPLLVKAVIKAESNFNCGALSCKGAQGLMQLMPETADDMAVADPFDPQANITGGTRYLRLLLNQFKGDLKLALAAYNAGPTVVKEAGRIPRYPETRRYVKKVLRNYRKYQAASSPSKRWIRVAYE